MQSTRAYGEDDPYVNIPITAGMIGLDGVMDLAVPIGCADIVVGGEYGFSIDRCSVSDNDGRSGSRHCYRKFASVSTTAGPELTGQSFRPLPARSQA